MDERFIYVRTDGGRTSYVRTDYFYTYGRRKYISYTYETNGGSLYVLKDGRTFYVRTYGRKDGEAGPSVAGVKY